jgi:hypothetical protein
MIFPWTGRRHWVMDFRFRRSGFPIMVAHNQKHIQDFCSAWIIVSGQSWVGFSLVSSSWSTSSSVSILGHHPVQAELLEIPSQGVDQPSLVAIELA